MKSNITVKTTKDGRPGAVFPIIAGFQLSGKQFSKSEQDLWDSKLKERQLRNFELFKEHLADHVRKSLHMSSNLCSTTNVLYHSPSRFSEGVDAYESSFRPCECCTVQQKKDR